MKFTSLIVVLLWCAVAQAQRAPVEADTQKTEPPPSAPTKWMKMDYGPFMTTSIVRRDTSKPNQKPEMVAYKGIAIKLPGSIGAASPSPGTPGEGRGEGSSNTVEAAVVFDTDLMTMSAGWTGGYLDLLGTMMAHHKGTANAAIVGEEIIRADRRPGWSIESNFNDPRPQETGRLPDQWGRYRGLYVNGDRIVLSYTIGSSNVLEMPGLEATNGTVAITRTFAIDKVEQPLMLRVMEPSLSDHVIIQTADQNRTYLLLSGDTRIGVSILGNAPGGRWDHNGYGVILHLPKLTSPALFKILLWPGKDDERFKELCKSSPSPVNIKTLITGGPIRWPQILSARGRRSTDTKSAYVVDDLTIPEDNPWTSWMRTTAVDFFSDGRAAVSTFNGDVWIVSGIDDGLEKLTWKRFAAGLYEPLGLRIVDGSIYVRCRDQITRLHDLNNDGEADFYENINNDDPVNPSYHGFCFELQTDRAGNFYYTRTGHRAAPGFAGHGLVHRVSADGKKHDVIASGLRAPNGLGIGTDDTLMVSDNQGNWVPSSKVHQIREGDFIGYMPQHHRPEQPSDYAKPLAWIPMTLDSSSGSPIYVASDKWGPLTGKWVHTSFGRATLSALLPESVDGQAQGAVVKLPLTFSTGIMRGRFHPIDGQLYLTGVGGGWQAGAPKDGGLYRVRYTGKPLLTPVAVTTEKKGVRLHFSVALDKESASDDGNYAVEQWNYLWSEAYGSPDFSVTDPKKKGRDEVAVKSATLAEDGKSVLLEIPDLQPVMQLGITIGIKSAQGAEIDCEVFKTLHRLPD